MGKAFIIPGVDWSGNNLGQVTRPRLTILGPSEILTGEPTIFTATKNGVKVIASWSISGDASLVDNGDGTCTVIASSAGLSTITATYSGETATYDVTASVPYQTRLFLVGYTKSTMVADGGVIQTYVPQSVQTMARALLVTPSGEAGFADFTNWLTNPSASDIDGIVFTAEQYARYSLPQIPKGKTILKFVWGATGWYVAYNLFQVKNGVCSKLASPGWFTNSVVTQDLTSYITDPDALYYIQPLFKKGSAGTASCEGIDSSVFDYYFE